MSGMGAVIMYMLFAVFLATFLLAFVFMTQRGSSSKPPRSKGTPKSVSRTPSADLKANVPVQAWPLSEQKAEKAATAKPQESSALSIAS